jgi:choline dehydrogenase
MASYYGPLIQPESDSKDDWAHFAQTTLNSYHHSAGTCAMSSVVDPQLRVYGMDNLRVADASVMPKVVHANTNLTCILIGERVAELLAESR